MKKNISKRRAAKSQKKSHGPLWQHVPMKVSSAQLLIALGVAVTRTADDEHEGGCVDKPWTVDQVLQGALQDGLAALEREWLGTSSLDPNVGEADAHEYPKSTRVMLALLRVVRS